MGMGRDGFDNLGHDGIMYIMTARYFGAPIPPRWHCLVVSRQAAAHVAARQFMQDAGAKAFFPSTNDRRRGRWGKITAKETPIIPGYVFAKFSLVPHWHLWPEHKWFRGVFKIGETPYVFSYAQIQHLSELDASLRAIATAKADAMRLAAVANRPVAGQQAEFTAGPFVGHKITVEAIDGAYAVFEFIGAKDRAKLDDLRRLAQ